MNFDKLNETNSTIVKYKGTELKTIDDPYINDDGTHYNAYAADEKGNEYIITWKITDHETIDESEICNWYKPEKITTI